MREYDTDGDGALNFSEYLLADSDVIARWRYKQVWRAFADADVDRDGVLNVEELRPLLPMTVLKSNAGYWMRRFDRAGAHGAATLADMVLIQTETSADDVRTIVSASLSMSIFLVYIKTAKNIMLMFSTEKIEGVAYLKSDISQKAYSGSHIVAISIASVYGAVFIIGIPVVAIYVLYLVRHRMSDRNVQAAFGFLFQGYTQQRFFWEFVVLVRKVLFLATALFWEDAFLQSIVALFIIITAIVLHMACWPYEQMLLNVAELLVRARSFSLSFFHPLCQDFEALAHSCFSIFFLLQTLLSLFSLVSLSLLLWYIQMPGNDTHLAIYELGVTLILFLEYSFIGIVLVARWLHCMLREHSRKLVLVFPSALPALLWAVRAEAWVYFQLSNGETLTTQAELWSFLAAAEDDAAGLKIAAVLSRVRGQVRGSLTRVQSVANMVFHPVSRNSLSRVPAPDDGSAERGAVAPGPGAVATASVPTADDGGAERDSVAHGPDAAATAPTSELSHRGGELRVREKRLLRRNAFCGAATATTSSSSSATATGAAATGTATANGDQRASVKLMRERIFGLVRSESVETMNPLLQAAPAARVRRAEEEESDELSTVCEDIIHL